MSRHGDYASRKLDQWQPNGLGGKIVKGIAQGARAVDRVASRDPHNATDGDPTRCHMRARRNGKECNTKLNDKQQREGHCGNHVCAKEYIAYTSDPRFNEYRDSTHRQVKRW